MRSTRDRRQIHWGAVPISLVLVATLVIPCLVLVVYSFWEAGYFSVVHTWTLDSYGDVLKNGTVRALLIRSIGTGLLCSAITVVVGYCIAYFATLRRPRLGAAIIAFVTLSTMASYVVRIYSWQSVLGTNGFINLALLKLGLISEHLSFLSYGRVSVLIVLVYVYLPTAVLPVYAALSGIDRRTIEAARDLGGSGRRAFFTVTLPQTAPALATSFALTFILTASDYVTPSLVGGLGGQMVGQVIQQQFVSTGNYPLGAALAVIFVGAVIVCLGLTIVIARAIAWCVSRLMVRLSRPRTGLRLRGARRLPVPVLGIVTSLSMLFLAVPLIVMAVFSFNDSPVPGLPWRGATTGWYSQLLATEDFRGALRTSLLIAVIALLGAYVVGIPAAMALRRMRGTSSRLLTGAVFGPVAIPGVVIGTALLLTAIFLKIPLGVRMTAVAHIMLILPFIVFIVRSRLELLDPQILEASRDLGASRGQTFRKITLPMLAVALLGAGLLAGAISFDQVVVTNFTIGANATVPTWIYGQARVGLTPAINAAAVLLILLPAVVFLGAMVVRRGVRRLPVGSRSRS